MGVADVAYSLLTQNSNQTYFDKLKNIICGSRRSASGHPSPSPWSSLPEIHAVICATRIGFKSPLLPPPPPPRHTKSSLGLSPSPMPWVKFLDPCMNTSRHTMLLIELCYVPHPMMQHVIKSLFRLEKTCIRLKCRNTPSDNIHAYLQSVVYNANPCMK